MRSCFHLSLPPPLSHFLFFSYYWELEKLQTTYSCLFYVFYVSSQAESVVCRTWCSSSNKELLATLEGSREEDDWTSLSCDYHVTISIMNIKQIHFEQIYTHCVQQSCLCQILEELMIFMVVTKGCSHMSHISLLLVSFHDLPAWLAVQSLYNDTVGNQHFILYN